jgi:hypothetical protein
MEEVTTAAETDMMLKKTCLILKSPTIMNKIYSEGCLDSVLYMNRELTLTAYTLRIFHHDCNLWVTVFSFLPCIKETVLR